MSTATPKAGSSGAAVRIEGLRETQARLKKVALELPIEVAGLNLSAATLVARTAVGLAPVETSKLARSIRMKANRLSGSVLAGSASVPYAGVIHFGWPDHNIAPQPFLYDALDERRGEVEATYRAGLGAIVERAGGAG